MTKYNILLLCRNESVDEIIKSLVIFGKVDIWNYEIDDNILKNKYDIIICYSYAPIIKEEILNRINANIINLHPSYLPYGQGVYPILWALKNNEPFGFSLFRIDKGIDSGDIYFRKKVNLNDDFTLRQARLFLMLGAQYTLIENFHQLAQNTITPVKQTNIGKLKKYNSRKESNELLEKINGNWDLSLKNVKKLLQSHKKSLNS